MNGIPNTMMIAITEAKAAIEGIESLEDRLRKAMETTKNHWMVVDEDERFKSAIGAVFLSYDEGTPEYERLKTEMTMLKTLSAATSGIPVDFGAVIDDDFKPIGLLGLWNKVKP